MKKTLIIFLCATFAFGCALSPEKRAQKLIKAHMKETMHDWSSYEPVKFGQLDSVYTTVYDKAEYSIYKNKIEEFDKLFNEALEKCERYTAYHLFDKAHSALDESGILIDSINKYKLACKEIENDYIPKFKGWSMTHTSRGNNALGNKIIGTNIFYFDPDITQIVDIKSMDDDD